MSAFFHPQGFLTAVQQNYSRKHGIATEKVRLSTKVIDGVSSSELVEAPVDGVLVYGLFIEGFRWDTTTHQMAHQLPNQIISELPMVHLLPTENIDRVGSVCECPLFKVQERKGVLSTTGCSTNFIMRMELPSKEGEEMWMKNRAAVFMSLKN